MPQVSTFHAYDIIIICGWSSTYHISPTFQLSPEIQVLILVLVRKQQSSAVMRANGADIIISVWGYR
jgi:hypothetical protein